MNINQIVEQTLGFIVYVQSFYGPDGLYPMGATIAQIVDATKILIDQLEIKEIAFDSFDRERVRDIMIEEFGLVFPIHA